MDSLNEIFSLLNLECVPATNHVFKCVTYFPYFIRYLRHHRNFILCHVSWYNFSATFLIFGNNWQWICDVFLESFPSSCFTLFLFFSIRSTFDYWIISFTLVIYFYFTPSFFHFFLSITSLVCFGFLFLPTNYLIHSRRMPMKFGHIITITIECFCNLSFVVESRFVDN